MARAKQIASKSTRGESAKGAAQEEGRSQGSPADLSRHGGRSGINKGRSKWKILRFYFSQRAAAQTCSPSRCSSRKQRGPKLLQGESHGHFRGVFWMPIAPQREVL